VSTRAPASSVLIARQPICDTNLRVQAYELLHRGEAVDGEQATAQVLLAACGDIGLGALVGERRAYVNVTRRFLLECDPLPFEPELVPTALVRAQTLSLLAAQRGHDADRAFAIGLFSVADALLGAPTEEALQDLPLAAPIVDAAPGGTRHALAVCYLQAIAWSQERSTAVHA
jgi:c-di-GMP-related signal transduction protein